jgi:DNA-binding protein HU-beta
MNKTELISAIAASSGLTKVDSKKALDGYLAAVKAELKKGGKVTLVGFGTYSVVAKKARTGINPKTKKPIKIAAKKVVKFKPGVDLTIK